MENTIEIFLHGAGRPQVVEGLPAETLRNLLGRCGALPEAGQMVFVGESDDAIRNPDAEADAHEPADIEMTLEVLELPRHRHVHTRAHHRIEVIVRYNGERKRRFSPAAPIAVVTAWAKKRFGIDPTTGADLILVLLPGKTQPRPDEHLSELLRPGQHVLEFDLVAEVKPQGWNLHADLGRTAPTRG